MRDAPHTGDFLTNPGNLAAPISSALLLALLHGIFLVFRALDSPRHEQREIRITLTRGLVDRSVYTCASDFL